MLRMVQRAGAALLVQAALHAQLLQVDWAEEKSRILKMAAAMLMGFACLLGLMLSLGVLLLALCWDTPYRIPAVAGLIALYGLGLALAGYRFQAQSALGSESFAATRTEFAADMDLLGRQL